MFAELGISEDDWQQTPQAVRTALMVVWQQNRFLMSRCTVYETQVERLQAQVAELETLRLEVAELRERLGRNSQNSSQPPSADPPFQRPARPHQKTGRKRGGQPGHSGYGRKLVPLSEVDRVLELRPTACGQCGSLLLGNDPQPVRRQVSEIPPTRAVITEYQLHTLSCLHCGNANTAVWPADLPTGSFGPRVQAIAAYLTGHLHLSHRAAATALRDLHGLSLGLGSIAALQQQVAQALAQPVATVEKFIAQQSHHHADETGWRTNHKTHWLWVDATAQATRFRIDAHRNQAAAQKLLGNKVQGIVNTDRCGAYNWVNEERRQFCWAHLQRDFQAIAERDGTAGEIGTALLAAVKELFTEWHRYRAGAQDWATFQGAMQPIQQQIKEQLQAGKACGHAKTEGTCQQILQGETSLWTFTRESGVEPTNNAAERAIRPAVLWRRKSFGTQSATGNEFVERILTAVTTLRQQKRNVLDWLTNACTAALGTPAPCCLLPDTS